MNSLFIRLDLAVLPPKQYNFVTTLLENHNSDQAKNLTLKGVISLGFFCLSQKELSLFSSNTIQKIQSESKVFRFRIYDSPEYKLFTSISKKARRATINALLYTGVTALQNLADEYVREEISAERKQKIDELIFKTGLYNEFELVLGSANFVIVTTTISNKKSEVKELDKTDKLASIPIPTVDGSSLKEFVSNRETLDSSIGDELSQQLDSSKKVLEAIETQEQHITNQNISPKVNQTPEINSELITEASITKPEEVVVESVSEPIVQQNSEQEANRSRWSKLRIDSA